MRKVWLFVVGLLLCATTVVSGKDFRFALISDLHVSPGSIGAKDLQLAVDQINATPGLDFVIVSGDVTEHGDRASLELVKEILSALNLPTYITSGNHETKWSESGATDFDRVFGADRFRFEYGGFLFLGFNTGPVIRMMEGHVAPQDISWLKEELDAYGTEKPVFLVTHYPMKRGDVDNWYTVTDLVRHYNIKAFLGGHYHSNQLDAYDGIPAFICRSTLRAKEPVGGYSLFEVTADSVIVYEQKIGGEPQRWGGYSLKKQYYTENVSGYDRPDFSMNQQYAEVKEVWMTELGNAIYSSPVLEKNRVYVGDDKGLLSCVRLSDGKLLWQFAAEMRIVGTPAVADGVVVFGSADHNIYGVDAKKGKQLWKIETSAAVLGAVTICDGTAYLGGSDGKFWAIDIHTGNKVWTFDGIKGYVETRPLIYGDKVIFGAWDENLYALNRKDGTLLWAWHDGRRGMLYSPAAVWPVATRNRVFIAAPDRFLSCIDATSGKTLWRTNESTVRETVGLSEDSTRVFSKTMRDSVVCFSTAGDAPRKIWATNVGFGYEIAPSMPVEKDGVVFGSTMNGVIYALEADTGRLLWQHKVHNSLISTVVPLDRNRCLFTSSAGIVGLLETK